MVQAIAFTIQNNTGIPVNIVSPDGVSVLLVPESATGEQSLPGMYQISPPGNGRFFFTINFGSGALNIIHQPNNTAAAHFLVTTRLAPSV